MSDDYGDSRYVAHPWNPVLNYNQPATIDGILDSRTKLRYDDDWFQIQLEKGYKYEFELIGNTLHPSDLALSLYDSSGGSIGYNYGSTSWPKYILNEASYSGTYYLNAEESSLTSGEGTYSLKVTKTSYNVIQNDDFLGNSETTKVLSPGQSIQGNLERRNDEDWFRVYLKGNTYVTDNYEYTFRITRQSLPASDISIGSDIGSSYYSGVRSASANPISKTDQFTFSPSIWDTSYPFFLKVKAYSPWSQTGSYTVSMGDWNTPLPTLLSTPPSTSLPTSLEPSYSLSTSSSSIDEGSTLTSTVRTTNVPTGTKLYWSASGTNITSSDFSSGELLGSESVGSDGTLSFSHTLDNDVKTEGSETLIINVFSDSSRSTKIVGGIALSINDTSKTLYPAYTISPSLSLIDEGNTLTTSISTNNVDAGTTLYWSLSGTNVNASDFSSGDLTGSGTIDSNGNFSFSHTLNNDYEIEGTETLNIQLFSDPLLSKKLVNTVSVSIVDISKNSKGNNSKNTIIGEDGNDQIDALGGDDTISGGKGNDIINGGTGSDTSIYYGNFSNYSFTRLSNSLKIHDKRNPNTGVYYSDGSDTLSNIEYIKFLDQTIEESKVDIVKTYSGKFSDYKFYNKGNGVYQIKTDSGYDDITGIPKLTFSDKSTGISAIADIKGTFDQVTGLNTDSGEMFRLYNAAFARFPDADGLKYWIDQFSSGKNTRRVVAQSFLGSAEFTEKYGSNVSDETYVNNLYKNVLGRDADTEGLNYWVGNLSSGLETRYEALLGFAESVENKALFTEMTGFG